MSVHAEEQKTTLHHKCGNCRSEMLLPEWVSMEKEEESVIFQCPICSREAEIDIGDYPMTRVRVVVNEWHDSTYAQRGS